MAKNLIITLLGLLFGLFLFIAGLVAVAVLAVYPKLPALDSVQNYQPKEPLMIYSAEGVLIGTYGDERRAFMPISEFPEHLKEAVLAAEDKRFYEHFGIDLVGITRAVIGNLSGGVKSGASTITQQVARNFYLTNERTLTRKFNEALLAYKIERTLTKDQILELYFNQIYLGQRAYGFASAAQIYFNKHVRDITLAEAAILAGLPKAPSAFNPIVNPERARLRQEYILNNMLELGWITPAEHKAAWNEQLRYERYRLNLEQSALYVAEMARQEIYRRYGEAAYTNGFKVYTTVNIANQQAATAALRRQLAGFDAGSAYRGAEAQLDLNGITQDEIENEIEQYLSNTYTVEEMIPAVILATDNQGITVYMQGGQKASINRNDMGIAKDAVGSKRLGADALKVGSLIRVKKQNDKLTVVQQPLIQGALVSLDAKTGAVRALVGGYDFHYKNFNRATQALRQPGSTFKPFVYSAALSRGLTTDTLLNDAPININGWQPKNSDGQYAGMITLRQALVRSKNTVSVRIAQAVGVPYTRNYIRRFGFRPEQLPETLSLALGAGSATPMQMAEGYAAFANGGYKISAYVIDKIEDSKGNLVAVMQPLEAEKNAQRILDGANAYTMTVMMKDVVQFGTAARASSLGRSDLAGKTGTTNDFKDAWFVGYNPQTVTSVYIGYDQPKRIDNKRVRGFGSTLALPVWIDYMRFALKGVPQQKFPKPKGMADIATEIYGTINEAVLEGDTPVYANPQASAETMPNGNIMPVPPLQQLPETPIPPAQPQQPQQRSQQSNTNLDDLF